MRAIGRMMRRAVDLVAAGAVLPFAVISMLIMARRRPPLDPARRLLIHLSGGASIDHVMAKFGSLDFLFLYDGEATAGLFSRILLCWYPTASSQERVFENGWKILERRRYLGCLPATGLVLSWLAVVRNAVEAQPCLIRAWDPYVSGFSAWVLSRILRLPYCVSIHADYDHRFALDGARGSTVLLGSRALAKCLERFVLRRAAMILPIRDSLVQGFLREGFAPVRLFPHGIDMSLFDRIDTRTIRRRLGIEDHVRLISFAGRLSRENYVEEILSIVALTRTDDFLLVMAGDGPERATLTERIQSDPALRHRIALPGFLTQEEILALRCASHLSLCLMAGFSLIEACAAGRPVISYDVEWHRELVRDGETGFLVPEHDIAAVARCIDRLLADQELATRMGAAAACLARERHDLRVVSSTKRAIYREIMASHS